MYIHMQWYVAQVCILTRREQVVSEINDRHQNPAHLASTQLPSNITATTDLKEALAGTSFIIHCIPVQNSYEFLSERAADIDPTVPIVSTSKGLHTDTLETMQGK
jgi:glycerol-3-phosphate dehydrogenase (NAD(P)+)